MSGQFWGELRIFLAVAKAKSFNRAGELLGMSQPTVSRSVKRLQDMMGTQLLVSSTTGIKLTERGEDLAQALSGLDRRLFDLSNDMKSDLRKTEGTVRVSVTDGLATFFVVPALREFAEMFPRILVALQNPINLVDYRENPTDIAIGFMPAGHQEIVTQPLGQLHFVPICSRAYIERKGLPTRSTLARHDFVQTPYYEARTGIWDPWQSASRQGRVSATSENSITYGLMVKAGLGIGLLGNYTAVEPSLVALDLDCHIKVRIFIAASRERLHSKPVKIVFDMLSEVFSAQSNWFGDRLNLTATDSYSDSAMRLMFNLE
ncbi:LysR family transcriptional regulator [Aurantimonas sp. Leaf443]|uniref:LysR family transcriptional regulator n=1 Tax=Aurantimonas sp. Leaf443 TaxID=1736378 RepID=UPI0006F38A05|nr:LysR family transcriptional regulator [Aurantimonas sp. Leaf443]KQT86288.1 hypothetical protein ASG48_06930 [Aurantimonas sp. Leaf443]